MKLNALNSHYQFERMPLEFLSGHFQNVFSLKNNKSLAETLEHPRYAKLKTEAYQRHGAHLSEPLGQFLLELKYREDTFYRRFLNAYGDETYSIFRLADPELRKAKGVYSYILDGVVMYIGRCRDAMSKRIDQGCGKIHPKNCYIDGQATNCHLNSLITKQGSRIEL